MRAAPGVFMEGWSRLCIEGDDAGELADEAGSKHRREDLLRAEFRELDLSRAYPLGDLLTVLRACTTNRVEESAFVWIGGKKLSLRIDLSLLSGTEDS